MKKIFYIFVFCNLFFFQGFTQDIDSLKLELKNSKHDSTRIKLLSELSEICEIEDILLYAEPCVKLCEKAISNKMIPNSFYLKSLSDALNNIGFLAKNQGDNTKALVFFQKSLKLREKIKDKKGIALSLINIGFIYGNEGDISKALNYFQRSLRQQEEIMDKYGVALSLINIGFIYDKQGDIPKALEFLHRSLQLREEIKDKYGIAQSLINIATIYDKQGDFSRAIEYLNRSLQLREEIKDKKGIATSLNNIGVIYKKKGDSNKALNYYNKSLQLRKEINDEEGIALSLINIGIIYKDNGDTQKALEYFQKSLKIFEKYKDKMHIALSLNNIGVILLMQENVMGALRHTNLSLQISKEMGYPESIKNAAGTLKNIFKKQNKYKAAFEMYELEIQMRDSINNEATKKASIQKQFQYEYEKKAAADSVVFAKENQIKEVEIARQKAEIKVKQNQQMALYSGLVLVLVFAGFMYNRFKVTQKQKAVIEQQKEVVEKAHELLEEKNSEILASIRYAKRIQDALLTSQKYIERNMVRLKSTHNI